MSDIELLELSEVGRRAIAENDAWKARNKAREEFREWRRKYLGETGEWFDRDEAETEDVEVFDMLKRCADDSQKALATARAATRRAIVRAAAAIGKSIKRDTPSP